MRYFWNVVAAAAASFALTVLACFIQEYGIFVRSIRTVLLCHHRAVGCCVIVLMKMNDVKQKSRQEEKSNHKHAVH